jgi:CHAT domain-containing protein
VHARAPRGRAFRFLEGSVEELTAIRARFGPRAEILTGGEATEARWCEAAPGKQILHLATHGFVRDDLLHGIVHRDPDEEWLGALAERQLARGHDPMLLAGLALSGANPRRGGGADDGILTALEISWLDLEGTDLVVLSACQTALGKPEAGEGVLGLVQAFHMAGARQVVGSLWRVDDTATRLLMEAFYARLAGGPRPASAATALRDAARHLRASGDARGARTFAHPYYWSAFAAYGRDRL